MIVLNEFICSAKKISSFRQIIPLFCQILSNFTDADYIYIQICVVFAI
jgi:hypothetical protein